MVKKNLAANATAREFLEGHPSTKKAIDALKRRNDELVSRMNALVQKNQSLIERIQASISGNNL